MLAPPDDFNGLVVAAGGGPLKSGERSAGGIPFPVREEKFFAFFSKISQKSGFAAKRRADNDEIVCAFRKICGGGGGFPRYFAVLIRIIRPFYSGFSC